ncbi:MAG: ATPase [Gammaproteobacteria bacterium]|nr:ATPase [Gammaproteobacteria bacterium]
MLKPLPMQRIALHVLNEDAPLAALVLADAGVFNPETMKIYGDRLPEFPGESYREHYRSARSRLDKVLAHCTVGLSATPLPPLRQVSEEELEQIDQWLREVWIECSRCQEGLRRIEEERKHVDHLIHALDNFAALDIDLGLLAGSKRFVDLHIGTVPVGNLDRLKQAVTLAGYVTRPFLQSEGLVHVVVAGPKGREDEVRPVLQAAGWRRVEIPPELHDRPEKVRRDLQTRFDRLMEDTGAQCRLIETTQKEFTNKLIAAYHLLVLAAPYAELGEALRGRGGLALIGGWVPKRDLPRVRERLAERLGNRFVLTARDPQPGERLQVPSFVQHSWFLQPIVQLVKTYGVPRYGEIDPTLLFAITFIAMYGMMFGDVGHGLVIALAGVVLRRRLRQFTRFVVAIGMSSMIFGAAYGSVFGYEELLHPLWMSPLSDPTRMLTLALYWGVGFIVLVTILNIRNRLVDGDRIMALVDRNGVAGLLFYLGMLFAGFRYASGAAVGWLEAVAVLVPYAAIIGHLWHENKVPLGERILIVVIEGFETIVKYISNTLSFLRVAAFSLNHVALAIAVFALAGMLDTAGHWLTVVLGNIFIIGFEGAIVAIQVLRLEYYEGFSRFFSGDGREFRPLTLALNVPGKP